MRKFIEQILQEDFKDKSQYIFDNSPLIMYLNSKMGAIDGDSKTRRSYGNMYAIYSIIHYYLENGFYNNKEKYLKFKGFDYTVLFDFCRAKYGGSKLQNHALNNRVNGEFINFASKKIKDKVIKELIIINESKYFIHIDYLYVDKIDISKTIIKIIEMYIALLKAKDFKLLSDLEDLISLEKVEEKKLKIDSLLEETSEARVFEIISYAILKNHYKKYSIFIGTTRLNVKKEYLKLYKTGRTNANDGGIDFVMKPLGRFFQVTEVNNYDKYLLDIDKVMRFPITFVIKTKLSHKKITEDINNFIDEKSGGMDVLVKRYKSAIEEIITINELKKWLFDMNESDINTLINDIDTYYKLEMNIDDLEEE